MVLYSSHCTKCLAIERLLDAKGFPYTLCEDASVYIPLAEQHGIVQMPFADIDGEIVDCKALQKMITELEV